MKNLTTHYTRAIDAVSGLEALRSEGLMSVGNLGSVIGTKHAYTLLSRLYRAASRDTTWAHVNSVPGLYYGRMDGLVGRTYQRSIFGGGWVGVN